MPMPVVKRGCCCMSLEGGCIVLGVVAILGAVINIMLVSWPLPGHKSRAPEENLFSLMMIMFSTVFILFNILLIIGVYRAKPVYLQVTILVNSLFIVFATILVVATCIFNAEFNTSCYTLGFVALGAILLTSVLVFSGYYILVINSLYLKMKLSPVPV